MGITVASYLRDSESLSVANPGDQRAADIGLATRFEGGDS